MLASLSPFAAALALLGAAASAHAQIAPLPLAGDAYATAGDVAISAGFVEAATGANRFEILLRDGIDGTTVTSHPIPGGTRYRYTTTLDGPDNEPFACKAELDVLQGPASTGYRFVPRITELPASFAVHSLGVAYELVDRPGKQQLLIPVFGGAEFDEPFFSLRNGRLDTAFAHSVQQSAYWSEDGSGLLFRAEDPSGTEPKRFLYEVNTLATPRTLRISLDYWLPDTDAGGVEREALAPIVVEPYQFDPGLEPGWYHPAKLYRDWVTQNACRWNHILAKGRLESRWDIADWIKELDLFVSEQFGWYTPTRLPADPLLNLARHKTGLGAENVFVGLWSWRDLQDPKGRYGSWYTYPETAAQIQQLLPLDVRVSGYTFPQAFDPENPFFSLRPLQKARVQDRNDVPLQIPLEDWAMMDVAAPELAAWYVYLGQYHAQVSGLSGMYMDLPVAAGQEDFERRFRLEEGTARAGYEGFQNILGGARLGAALRGRSFATYHEAAFEWLIGSATLGQGAIGLFGRAGAGNVDTRSVPYFQTVYSGYTAFWPADPGLGTQTLAFVPGAYGPFDQFNISRLQAEGVVLGGVPNTSELFLPDGLLFYEVAFGDPVLDLWLQHHKQVLTNAIALRRAARPWLVYGEMLNDPRIGGDSDAMTLTIAYADGPSQELFLKPRVHTRAWKAKDDSVRVLAFNGHVLPGLVILDLARIGRPNVSGLRDTATNEFFPATPSGNGQSITVSVTGGAWRLLAIE